MANPDLAARWDEHCRDEFVTRDVDATMATMVANPYVNHIPTMTGGVGYRQLRYFYANHFIGVNPPDFRLVPVSRTIGPNSLVDEFVVQLTHITQIDWMLPGIPPTGRRLEIHGPKTAGSLHLEAKKSGGLWTINSLSAEHSHGQIQLAPTPSPCD